MRAMGEGVRHSHTVREKGAITPYPIIDYFYFEIQTTSTMSFTLDIIKQKEHKIQSFLTQTLGTQFELDFEPIG